MYTRRLHSGTVCSGISPHFALFRFIRKLHSRAACRYNYILRKSARSAPLHSSNQNYIRLPRVYLTVNRTVVVPLLEFPADPPQYDALYSNTRLLIPQFPANCRFLFASVITFRFSFALDVVVYFILYTKRLYDSARTTELPVSKGLNPRLSLIQLIVVMCARVKFDLNHGKRKQEAQNVNEANLYSNYPNCCLNSMLLNLQAKF